MVETIPTTAGPTFFAISTTESVPSDFATPVLASTEPVVVGINLSGE